MLGFQQPFVFRRLMVMVGLALALTGCSTPASQAPVPGQQSAPEGRQLNPQQAERLKVVMIPLVQNMNHPIPLDQVRIGVMDDPHINAANAGGGEFRGRMGGTRNTRLIAMAPNSFSGQGAMANTSWRPP